ncbi:bumetanide-sensitive sodium-(potassium)-chloride cotransporter isoform X2 [Orussus abietinus]|uniref:bumetanide-sensitive sodium-(potassium)-chloride cotransporter isoform X2 n=1 Tax=Orussus abietinus TaxID=222816 RepID=UPI000625B809|nr:bumetanide-sensitive sodium-(potassium)-chloride cotransporter isoform X2 [Orussus abietinus]
MRPRDFAKMLDLYVRSALKKKPAEMEGKFQSKNEGETNGSVQQNNKRSTMTLNVNGLWDVVPRLDHYRLSKRAKRPSLSELHDGNPTKDTNVEAGLIGAGQSSHGGIKLGWIQGVLIPCLLNIWGVMLFLRLSWVVAQAGILQSAIILGVSAIVCVITTLSLSAISTNGEVKGGGIYFIISRSLGPEFGASVGIVFAFANAVAASMNTIGFCDSLNDLLRENGLKIIDNGVNDVRIVGVVAILVMILICAIGMEWESKAQNFLIAVIVGAIFDFLIGTMIGPKNVDHVAQGFVGFSTEVFMKNWGPDYRYSENNNQTFFSVFAIFFPSVTGIQAGANISGDLKDPASSIPIGTLLALLISTISYVTFALFAGGAALRDASGIVTANGTIVDCIPTVNCTYGLHNSYTVMQLMSFWGPFIYAGCFAATLSTALTNLLSVPRLIQALGQDRIYPGLIYFAKGYGKSGEPYRGYVLTFGVAALFLLIANLNAVAPLISNFYLASYALINFCTFHAALIRPLGWRPTFKYYNTWLSLVGFILCVGIMFLIDWVTSLITFVIIFALYLIVVYRKPNVNWGSSTQAQTYKTALSIVYRLNSIDEHVKNYAPQILALSGAPGARPALLHLANLITKNHSLLISGEVYPAHLSHRVRSARLRRGYSWLQRHRVKSFYHIVEDVSLERGTFALMQASGVGKLAPNVVLMGYKTHWSTCSHKDLQEYFNVLHNAFDHKLAMAILRVPEGLDCSNAVNGLSDEEHSTLAQSSYDLAGNTLMHADSDLSMSGGIPRVQSVPAIGTQYAPAVDVPTMFRDSPNHGSAKDHVKNKKKQIADRLLLNNGVNGTPEYTTIFQKKHKHGTIDVWWLYDDGEINVLRSDDSPAVHNQYSSQLGALQDADLRPG